MSSQRERSKTIVSVTPLAVLADSRTFKQAASMKRFGFYSIVVEGETSQFNSPDLPFELHSISNIFNQSNPPLPNSTSRNTISSKYIRVKAVFKKIYEILPLSFREVLEFILFIKYYFNRFFLLPILSIPRASLYYMHSPAFIPAVYFLSKRYKVPFIYDAHDFYTGIEENNERSRFERRWIDPFYKKIEGFCMSHAAAVVTVSEGVARLQQLAFGVHPIVIRSCQDLRLEKPPLKGLREEIGLSWDDFLLVAIGQAKKGMAICEALEALMQLPPRVHLALIGKNQDRYFENIHNYSLGNRVHILQPLKPYEVISYVKSADVAILLYYSKSANYENCLPNGFFQSIAAGLPILYPGLPEIKRLAESYKLGIPINPRSPNSISEAVMALMDNPVLVETYRQNTQRAMQELNWEKEEVILRSLVFDVLRIKEG